MGVESGTPERRDEGSQPAFRVENPPVSPRHIPLLVVLALGAAALPATAAAAPKAPYEPDEVIVKFKPGVPIAEQREVRAEAGLEYAGAMPTPRTAELQITGEQGVRGTVRELEADPRVEYAVPNYIAHATGFIPNDPGRGGPQGWQQLQWNFLAPAGIDAPGAWSNLIAAGRVGGKGVTIAQLDTGVAYENRGRFRKAPDLLHSRFVKPYDFVEGDRHPDDANGHGTHVAGTLAQQTNNRKGVTGVAYRAKIMPLRVLDAQGEGSAADIARALRYAARKKARVVNMSLEFGTAVTASEIPDIISAISYVSGKGVVVIGASGNEGEGRVAYPARSSKVISVGATTDSRCLADYSNGGIGLDLVAPGGGDDAIISGDARCDGSHVGRPIYQVTFPGTDFRRFAVTGIVGTSMSTPHVSGAAALVIASGVIGKRPSPAAIQQRLESTASDLGLAGRDTLYGSGLLNANAATAPTP